MSTANVPDLASPIELDERYRTSPLTQLERGDEGPGWVASIRGLEPG